MRPSPRSTSSALAAVLVVAVIWMSANARAGSTACESSRSGLASAASTTDANTQTPPPAPAPQDAPAGDPEAEIAAARTALVTRLVALAQWCHKSELFEECDKIWTQVLVLDAKNIDAHKGLGHSRSADGVWHETNRHVYKNRSTKLLPELPAKRAEAMKPFSEALVARAKEAKSDALRNTYISAVLALDPDDPTVHAFQGDARDGEKWVLPESVGAKDRRAALKELVRTSLETAPETKPEATLEKDPKPAFPWKVNLTTGSVRVFSTGPEEDAKQIARTCTSAKAILTKLFGEGFELPPQMTFYVIDPSEKEGLLATFTGVDETDLANIRKLEGSGIPRRQDVALWTGNKARTLDMAVRQTLSFLFNRGIGLTPSCGWVWEGFGIYLTREITGTRLTWFIQNDMGPTAAALGALRTKLRANDANWMAEGLTILSAADAPQLADVMKSSLAKLTVREAVVAYVLAAYLVEARPDVIKEFTKRSSDGELPEAITNSLLSMSPQDLQKRLVRWLNERK